MAGLDNQAEIGRESTTVTGAGGLIIWVGWGHVVGKFSGTLEHLSLVVGTIRVFDLLSHCARFISGMGYADQVAPGNAVERMAGSADLAVDLISTANAR